MCISACEIPIALFCQFLDDPDYPAQLKPAGRPPKALGEGRDSELPVCYFNFVDCMLFCNWLSSKDGRQPCYVQDKKSLSSWTCHYGRNGYRLLTAWDFCVNPPAETLAWSSSSYLTLAVNQPLWGTVAFLPPHLRARGMNRCLQQVDFVCPLLTYFQLDQITI